MTPEEQLAYGKFIRDRAFALGIVRGMELANQTRQFSAATPEPKPKRGFAQVFSADDCSREHVDKYFSANEEGHHPGWMHLCYGMKWNEFADRSHLRRVQITNKLGRKQWVWIDPNKQKPGAPRTAHPENTPAKPSADYHPTAAAETAVAFAVANPATIRPERFEELANHLDTLQKDRLQDLARQLSQKVSGPKQQLVDRLLNHLRSQTNPEQVPGAALEREPPRDLRSLLERLEQDVDPRDVERQRAEERDRDRTDALEQQHERREPSDPERAAQAHRDRMEQWAGDRPESVAAQEALRRAESAVQREGQPGSEKVAPRTPEPTAAQPPIIDHPVPPPPPPPPAPLTPQGIASTQSRERANDPANVGLAGDAVVRSQQMATELGKRGYVRNKYGFRDKQGYWVKPGQGWSVKDATGKWNNLSGTEAWVEFQKIGKEA